MRQALLMLCLCAIASAAQALGPDPHRDWLSADSQHFRINYAAPQRAQAERIADIAERVYANLARELQWEPRSKIEIIVLDEFDFANGYSTPLPFNRAALFLTPPDDGELLDNSVWLELLLTHELTHTFHLDKVHDAPGLFRNIFGRPCSSPTCGSRAGPSKASPPITKAPPQPAKAACAVPCSRPGCVSSTNAASNRWQR